MIDLIRCEADYLFERQKAAEIARYFARVNKTGSPPLQKWIGGFLGTIFDKLPRTVLRWLSWKWSLLSSREQDIRTSGEV